MARRSEGLVSILRQNQGSRRLLQIEIPADRPLPEATIQHDEEDAIRHAQSINS
jgi:hypothetical protein